MRTDKLPGVPDKLLKPVPRSLRLLYRAQLWCAGLVFRKLRADQVEDRGHSFLDFDAVGLPGVPVLDQLVEVFLVLTLSTMNRAGRQYKHKKRNVE